MSEVTVFDWDHLYILGPYSNPSSIRELADLPSPVAKNISVDEGDCLLVFLAGKDIVFYLSFNRRHGDFAPVSRDNAYPRGQARFFVPADQPKHWPKVRWAGAT
jgi:hypothetical protein